MGLRDANKCNQVSIKVGVEGSLSVLVASYLRFTHGNVYVHLTRLLNVDVQCDCVTASFYSAFYEVGGLVCCEML